MLVAGDHANNDMAGEEDSFASLLREEGYAPECILRGIAEYPAIREVYLSHLQKLQVRCLRILRHRIVRESFTESV